MPLHLPKARLGSLNHDGFGLLVRVRAGFIPHFEYERAPVPVQEVLSVAA